MTPLTIIRLHGSSCCTRTVHLVTHTHRYLTIACDIHRYDIRQPLCNTYIHRTVRSFTSQLDRRLQNEISARQRRDELTNPLHVNICIIGRPNVGKSTLFNRLTGKQMSIVSPIAGVTRDRHEEIGSLFDLKYNVIDTAGLDTVHDIKLDFLQSRRSVVHNETCQLAYNQPLSKQLQHDILMQTCKAIDKSDIILFVIDARNGVTEKDREFAAWLRTQLPPHQIKRIMCVANKAELSSSTLDSMQQTADECYTLGFGKAIAISAQHNDGIQQLYDAMKAAFHVLYTPDQMKLLTNDSTDDIAISQTVCNTDGESVKHVRLAVVGRPNVGKSTLINSILGEDRCLTGNQPGITRDSQPLVWRCDSDQHEVMLVDTAGLKGGTVMQRSRYSKVDTMAMQNALNSIDMSNVSCLVIDAATHLSDSNVNINRSVNYNSLNDQHVIRQLVQHLITSDDLSIAQHILEQGRSLVLIANKFDRVPKHQRNAVLHGLQMVLQSALPQAKHVPILPVSAVTKYNINCIRDAVLLQYDRWNHRVSTGKLNAWLRLLTTSKPHPQINGKSVKMKYITQIKSRPPTFAIFCNRNHLVSDEYQRFLVNSLRDQFDMAGVPIRLLFRASDNPFVATSKHVGGRSARITTIRADQLDLTGLRATQKQSMHG